MRTVLRNDSAKFLCHFLRDVSHCVKPIVSLDYYIIAFNITFLCRLKSLMIIYYNIIVLRIAVYLNAYFSIHGYHIHYVVLGHVIIIRLYTLSYTSTSLFQ